MLSERFSRQSKLISPVEQSRLHDSNVAIVGCGGLGSQVIANLVSAGVGGFVLIDPDTVSESNLNRQFIHFGRVGGLKTCSARDWILKASPDARVTEYATALDEGNASDIVAKCDIAVDCLDNVPSRLTLAKACRDAGRILVHGGVEAYCGQVATFLPSSGFTMEKLMRSDVPDHVSYAPAVSVVGALMVHSVISALLGRPEEGLTVVDVSAGSVRKVPVH